MIYIECNIPFLLNTETRWNSSHSSEANYWQAWNCCYTCPLSDHPFKAITIWHTSYHSSSVGSSAANKVTTECCCRNIGPAVTCSKLESYESTWCRWVQNVWVPCIRKYWRRLNITSLSRLNIMYSQFKLFFFIIF